MKLRALKPLAPLLMTLASLSLALAQNDTPVTIDPTRFGTVLVYLRTEDGQPLQLKTTPIISIRSSSGGTALANVPVQSGDGWVFNGITINEDYRVIVTLASYLPSEEAVRLPNSPAASSSVVVVMRPIEQELVFHPPTGQFVLAPRAEKEIQRALQDLQSGKVPSAQKHSQNAIQTAPQNPYALYVVGLTYLLTNHLNEAKPYLEKSVSIDSSQPLSLRALGTVRYRLGDNAGAVQVLSKAVQLDGASWKAEWLLASAYLGEKKYPEARNHAEQALKVGKRNADQVQLVLGVALANLGDREKAAGLFDAFATEFPSDPNTPNAVKWAKMMREPSEGIQLTANLSMPVMPPAEVPPRPDWAPPDVDAVKPFVVSGATCPLAQILKTAGVNAEQLVTTLQEFSAKEDFQGIEIKRSGQLERPDERAFTYMVFINKVSPQAFDVKESRNQGTTEVNSLGRVSDTGVPAMALAFHPVIQPDLDWKCEGLGTWNDQPAWVVHFQQRSDRPNTLAWFSGPLHNDSLPLKGRAWISEQTGQVMHLDTDLIKPIELIDLKRQHFSIDYKQVSFRTQKVNLWLPENVDTYIQFQGHFLHYYHHFSDFKLFWVGATQKIGNPRDATIDQQ